MMAKGVRMTGVSRGVSRPSAIAAAALMLSLGGCLSLGAEPPESLLTLTPANFAPIGETASGSKLTLLAVLEPDAPKVLDVNRVPVQVDGASIAYLKDAQWVDKPARLFQLLLAETIRSKGNRMVVGSGDLQFAAATKLTGHLSQMGYDAASQSAVVRMDAMLLKVDGSVQSQRFEAVVPGVIAEAGPVGVALNQAANDVAAQVAEWVDAS